MNIKYQISNFKSFGLATIPIRPITLIFGPNSSGKSSILQSLLMFKQTVERGGQTLVTNGPDVNLGMFTDMIHKHDTNLSFAVNITLDRKKALDELLNWGQHTYGPEDFGCRSLDDHHINPKYRRLYEIGDFHSLGLQITFSYVPASSIETKKIELFVGNDPQPLIIYSKEKPVFCHFGDNPKIGDIFEEDYPGDFFYINCIDDLKHNSFVYDDGPFLISEINFSHDFWNYYPVEINQEFMGIKKGVNMLPNILRKLSGMDKQHINDVLLNILTFGNNSFFLSNFLPLHFFDGDNICQENRFEFFRTWWIETGKKNFKMDEKAWENDDDGTTCSISFYTKAAAFTFRQYLKSIIHIGPIRDRFTELNFNKRVIERINEKLDLLDMGYHFKSVRFFSDTNDYLEENQIRLFDKKHCVHVKLSDVGVGISQVLPIIIESIVSMNKTLLIEQPELHLHPALQGNLTDILIDSSALQNRSLLEKDIRKKRVNDLDSSSKNRFFIETHSEHIILRILRRIRETSDGTLPEGFPAITPEDVAVLYVKPGQGGSDVIHIPITSDGDFEIPWPDGFFEERVKELF